MIRTLTSSRGFYQAHRTLGLRSVCYCLLAPPCCVVIVPYASRARTRRNQVAQTQTTWGIQPGLTWRRRATSTITRHSTIVSDCQCATMRSRLTLHHIFDSNARVCAMHTQLSSRAWWDFGQGQTDSSQSIHSYQRRFCHGGTRARRCCASLGFVVPHMLFTLACVRARACVSFSSLRVHGCAQARGWHPDARQNHLSLI